MSAKNSRLSIINNTKYCIMDLPALLKEIFPVGLFLPKCMAAALFGGILAANWLIVFIVLVFTLLALLCSEFVRNFLRTLPRDVKGYLRLRRLQSEMEAKWAEGKSIGEHFLGVVERHPQKTAIIEAETGRSLDFQSLDQLANKFGNFFLAEFKDQNAESPTVVGLLVGNCVEFVALWLGLSRAGLISAWLNTQLRGQSLAHSLMIAGCGAVVTTEQLLPALLEVLDANKSKQMRVFVLNPQNREKWTTLIKPLLADQLADDSEPIPPKKIGFQTNSAGIYSPPADVLAFLFTSGTTGQPKAVIIRHHRFYFMGAGGRIIYGIRPSDRLYCTLPMFHGMAGIASVGQMVVNGSSIVIRSKFSASHFWSDCLRFRCTVGIYIGEICRYLLGQPRTKEEGQHRIRLLCGLGLRPSLWEAFGIRFGIHQIGELYGATEGNATCVNLDYEMGACGFLPTLTAFMAHTSIRLVKLDPESGEYVRKRDGLCVLCMPGESGEIVGMIREGNPTQRFEGYLERAETEKKLLHNVESVGDCAFASGDILHWDRLGYLFFKDRRGDSYRWKGENVSSSEVESLLLEDQRIGDLAVFGVPVPGQEGKAGMCALALAHTTQKQEEEEDADEELEALVAHIGHKFRQNLAPFAIPLFLRVCPGGLERTGTFKLKKAKLQAQGLLPVDGQTQFVWDRRRSEYVRFETDGWEMHVI